MKVLVIGEKSNQCKKFASVLFDDAVSVIKKSKYVYLRKGAWNGYDITFLPLAGHITRIDTTKDYGWGKCEPISIVTDEKALCVREDPSFKKYIMDEASKVDELWLATDPDSEGDNIALEAYNIAIKSNPELKKNTKRVWNSSLTKKEILRSFENLRKWDDSLALGVQGRRYADVWVGFAGTREITRLARSVGVLQGKKIFSVGRVQLPTLYLIVKRDREIEDFIPKTKYNIFFDVTKIDNKEDKLIFKHILSPFDDKNVSDKIMKKLKNEKTGVVVEFMVNKYYIKPPKPLNTTDSLSMLSAQLNISAEKGLQIMADLYENGYLSYPRTDNRKFKDDFPHKDILIKLKKYNKYTSFVESCKGLIKIRVNGNSGGVEDHDPIHPTGNIPKISDKITNMHLKAWDYFSRYYIGEFMSDMIHEKGIVKIDVNDEVFIRKYNNVIDEGWCSSVYWKIPKNTQSFNYKVGDVVSVSNLAMTSFKTKPPRRWSDASILRVLEKERIGTKSSRPDILKKIVLRGYVDRVRGCYKSTEYGRKIIGLLEDIWKDLITSRFTRLIEDHMDSVATKKKQYIAVLNIIRQEYLLLHNKLINSLPEFRKLLTEKNKENIIQCDKEGCDGIMIKRVNRKTKSEFYGCSNFPKCKNTRSIN